MGGASPNGTAKITYGSIRVTVGTQAGVCLVGHRGAFGCLGLMVGLGKDLR